VHTNEPAIQKRVLAFRAQWPSTAPVLRSGVRFVEGVCYSCMDRLAPGRFGRCWRCALALRLAHGLRLVATDDFGRCTGVSRPVPVPLSAQDPDPAPVPVLDLHPDSNPEPSPDHGPDNVPSSDLVSESDPHFESIGVCE
jgi:hypothetical protein